MKICQDALGAYGMPCPAFHPGVPSNCDPQTEYECGGLAAAEVPQIFNGTPHPVHIVANSVFVEHIRKYIIPDGQKPQIVASIPSNGVLSAKIDTVELDSIGDVPVYGKSISGCDPLPEGYDIIVVSQLYATAARMCGMDTSKLYTVADPVYSADGRTILGCRGLCPVNEGRVRGDD